MRGLVLAVALGVGPVEDAPSLSDPDAQAELDRAMEAFAAEDYVAAAAALEASYRLEPNDRVLLAWAQAERFGGNCPRARELYQQYLEQELTAEDRKNIEGLMALCPEPEVPPAPPAATEPEPAPPPAGATVSPGVVDPVEEVGPTPPAAAEQTIDDAPPDSGAARPWSRDPAGIGLAISAGVVAGVGVGLLVAARVSDANANDESDHDAFRDRLERAIGLERASIGLFAGAGALAIGSAIAFGVAARRSRARPTAWVGPRGAGISISTRF